MAKLLVVCVLLSIIAAVYSLKCVTSNCNTQTCSEQNEVTCGQTASGTPACLKFVFKDKSGATNYTRKCVVEDPKNKYTCTTPAGGQEIFCELCNTDGCNSAPGVNINSFNVLASTACLLFVVKLFV